MCMYQLIIYVVSYYTFEMLKKEINFKTLKKKTNVTIFSITNTKTWIGLRPNQLKVSIMISSTLNCLLY